MGVDKFKIAADVKTLRLPTLNISRAVIAEVRDQVAHQCVKDRYLHLHEVHEAPKSLKLRLSNAYEWRGGLDAGFFP